MPKFRVVGLGFRVQVIAFGASGLMGFQAIVTLCFPGSHLQRGYLVSFLFTCNRGGRALLFEGMQG